MKTKQEQLLYKLDNSVPIIRKYRVFSTLFDLIDQFNALRADVARLYLQNQLVLIAPTLAITATSGKKVPKSTTAFAVWVGGAVQSKAANTDMSAISGTVAAGKAALWAWYISADGTITTSAKAGTAATTTAEAAALLKPAVPAGLVELGYITLVNGSASTWTGGTDALDAADVTVAYHSNSAISEMADMTATAVTPIG